MGHIIFFALSGRPLQIFRILLEFKILTWFLFWSSVGVNAHAADLGMREIMEDDG